MSVCMSVCAMHIVEKLRKFTYDELFADDERWVVKIKKISWMLYVASDQNQSESCTNHASLLFMFCFALTLSPPSWDSSADIYRERGRGKWQQSELENNCKSTVKCKQQFAKKPEIIRHSRGWFAIFVSFVDLVVVVVVVAVNRGGMALKWEAKLHIATFTNAHMDMANDTVLWVCISYKITISCDTRRKRIADHLLLLSLPLQSLCYYSLALPMVLEVPSKQYFYQWYCCNRKMLPEAAITFIGS